MTRAVVFGLVLLTAAFIGRGYVQEAKATPNWREKECRYQSLQPGIWTPREERLTAECAVSKWSVPGGLSEFLAIASCESGWSRFAYNGNPADFPRSGYAGLFQHAASAYVSRIRAYSPPSWDRELSTRWMNSRGQIVMSARYMHANGLGAWACA